MLGKSIKNSFPLLEARQDLIFLDNAASCQKPVVVLKAMDNFYRTSYANVHRGVYSLSETATEAYEGARAKVARFINAASPDEVVFSRNATHALNTAAQSLGQTLQAGDEILLTQLEHHANLVPWQQMAERYGLKLVFIPVTDEGRLDLSELDQLLGKLTRVVAVTMMSNVTGTLPELEVIISRAKAQGAKVLVDAAQGAQHCEIDVQKLGCDLLAFSGHKVFGPSGIGVLWCKQKLLRQLAPFEFGGNMIQEVTYERATFAEPPAKFEAGTPPIAEAVGLGAAVEFIESLGWGAILAHEDELTRYGLERLNAVRGLRILGPREPQQRGPVFAFTLEGVHPHDLASLLDEVGVAVRAGHHCAMPLHKRFGVPATTRASFTIYNTEEDVDALVAGLKRAQTMLR